MIVSTRTDPLDRNMATLLILGAAHSLNHSLFLVVPPLLNLITRDLNATFQTMGLVITLTYLIYGAGALIGGPLSDKIGPVKVSAISIGLAGASALIFILAKDLTIFSIGMFIMALWASFYHPTSNNLIAGAFTSNTAEAMGIHGAAGSVGQIFTPTVAFLLGFFIDWRLAFVFFGVLSMVTAFLVRKIPESKTPSRTESMEKTSPLAVFRVPFLWLLFLFNVFIGLYFRGVELFFPTFLSLNRGLSGELAAISNSIVLFFGVIGQYVGGKAADRYGSTKVVVTAAAGILASMLILLAPLGIASIALFIVLFGLSYFGHQPAMTAIVGSVVPRNLSGTAFGVMFFFAFGLGSLSAAMAGYLADIYDLTTSFWALTLFSMLTFIVSIAITRKFRK